MRLINLTQHSLTFEQIAGNEVFRKEATAGDIVCDRLTFNEIPTHEEMEQRALELARLASQHAAEGAIIGGAGYFMPYLEKELLKLNIIPMYSFTRRESVEKKNADGSITKTSIFKHIGWVRANANVYEGY